MLGLQTLAANPVGSYTILEFTESGKILNG